GRPPRRGRRRRRRAPGAPRDAVAVRARRHGGDQRGVRDVRQGHRVRHRRGALGVVGGVPPGVHRRPVRRADQRRGRGVVARGAGRLLAAAGGPGLVGGRPREPPRGARVVARRAGLRRVGGQAPAHRGRVGVRRARRARGRPVPLGRRAASRGPLGAERLAGPLPHPQHRRGRLPDHRAGEVLPPQRPRAVADGRQRLGVVLRPVLPGHLPPRRGRRPDRPRRGVGGGGGPGHARRVVPLPRLVLLPLPGGRTLVEHPGVQLGEPRVPLRDVRDLRGHWDVM
ncbi:MAG: Sulfatase modifying factor 1 precursor (C-alpha-formyglycine- generating enzyme 1), partial [uncultured Actinomycetospora sp.]